MRDWHTLPWLVRSDDAARARAERIADLFEAAPVRLKDIGPVRRDVDGAVEHVRMVGPTLMASDDHLSVAVQELPDHAYFDISARLEGVEIEAAIRCCLDLLKPRLDDPEALIALGIRLLRTAARTDPVEATVGRMSEDEAVEIAALMGFDWTSTFEAVKWTASPLSPARMQISAPAGLSCIDDPRPSTPVPILLRTMSMTSKEGIWLGAEPCSRECDGFDAMETLRMHRRLETMP